MKGSIVIPTANRSSLLAKTILSIYSNCDTSKFELLICDNNSKDDTQALVESFVQKYDNIRYFKVPKPGLHEGRHTGYNNAKFDIICYLDDDVEVGSKWLDSILLTFEDKGVALVGGKCLPNFESQAPTWLMKKWDTEKIIVELSVLDLGEEIKSINPNYVFGCNFSIRKEILDQSQGFHPDGMPDDLMKYRGDGETYIANWLNNQDRWKTIYNPSATVFHNVSKLRLTKRYLHKSKFRAGVSASYTYLRSMKPSFIGSVFILIKYLKRFILSPASEKPWINGAIFHTYNYMVSSTVRTWVHKEHYL